jgi:ribonuclease VapC
MTAPASGMFIDASALVAIIDQETDWKDLMARLEQTDTRLTSPLAIWEAANAMERLRAWGFDDAERAVNSFLDAMEIATIDVTAQIGQEALRAARLYGKGRHPARLNFGDCFAYACAKILGVPLLCKGNDFAQTDIKLA